jgi:hypothetical protein
MVCSKKCRTEGLLIASYNCGIVFSYREFYQKESVGQVANFYLETIKRLPTVPKFLIYDDGCHLRSFFEKKNYFAQTDYNDLVKEIIIAVDRFHFKGNL